jgi:hypothetical protein
MRVLSRFRMVTRSVHGKKLDVTKSYHLNYLRFKLIKVENAKSISNPHEQGVLTSFLGLESLELILVNLS